jgi:hypothetical protein
VTDPPAILPTAVFVIVNKFVTDVVRIPDVRVSVPESDDGPFKETPFALFMVKLFKAETLEGIVIPVEEPPKTKLDEDVVLKFVGVPAIAGPLSVSVFAPTENVPLVSVSVPLITVEPDNPIPLELSIVKLFKAATLDGTVIPAELPPNVNDEDDVVLKFVIEPAIAGPFKAKVFEPIENVPLVSVSVPAIEREA